MLGPNSFRDFDCQQTAVLRNHNLQLAVGNRGTQSYGCPTYDSLAKRLSLRARFEGGVFNTCRGLIFIRSSLSLHSFSGVLEGFPISIASSHEVPSYWICTYTILRMRHRRERVLSKEKVSRGKPSRLSAM
jgi:hypothetical protein